MKGRTVVVVVVILCVLIGGALVADGVLRGKAQDRIATDLQTQMGLDATPEVGIDGFPFLTQVVGDRELDHLHIAAEEATVSGMELRNIDVELEGVTTQEPYTARHVSATASIPIATIRTLLDIPADLDIKNGQLVASTKLFGLPLKIALTPRAAGRSIAIDVETLSLAGAAVSADNLPPIVLDQVQGLEIPMTGLPKGMELMEITVTPIGVDIQAEGTDVELDAEALGG
jgi:hypothetical protein